MKSRHLFLFLIACGSPNAPTLAEDNAKDELDSAITDVDQSIVKRQSIGNCWIYATATWAESLHLSATGEATDLSESYWTYWHWFEEISRGRATNGIETGGSYDVAKGLILRYGYTTEAEFIAEEKNVEMSRRQASALEAMNAAITDGPLNTAAARSNKALVLSTLNKAWGLSPKVVQNLTSVFGADASRNFRNTAVAQGIVKAGSTFVVQQAKPSAEQGKPALSNTTLTRALSNWREEGYQFGNSRRAFLRRVQRALHDKQPLIISWFVDFNALDEEGRFMAPPATPGSQGGHMVVAEDYQVNKVPGFGTLEAGTLVTDQAALEAALSPTAEIEFFRVKNSWGGQREDRQFVPGMPGYHDLYMDYLNGPIAQCDTDENGHSDTSNCPWTIVPLSDVVFPAGY